MENILFGMIIVNLCLITLCFTRINTLARCFNIYLKGELEDLEKTKNPSDHNSDVYPELVPDEYICKHCKHPVDSPNHELGCKHG